MGYRDEPNQIPRICDVTTAAQLHVLNGLIAEFAIPCYYVVPVEGSETETQTVPIDLTAEGYGDPIVAVDNVPDGLSWLAWIDPDDTHIVRFVVNAQCPDAVSETVTCNVAVLVTRTTAEHGDRTDAVFRGQMSILPSPIASVAPVLPDQPVGAASRVSVVVTNFDGLLSDTDVNVQAALDTLDDHTHDDVAEHTHDLIEHTHDYDMTPAGAVTAFAGSTAPSGWLLCNGQAVSRTTYADLFAIVGTEFGSGDGVTTFNLPNLKGRVPVGLDGADGDFYEMGETGGAKTHTLTSTQMPAHTHSVDAVGGDTPSTAINYVGGAQYTGGLTDTVSGAARSTGGGGAHNNLQPYLVMNYIIKT